MDPLRVGVVGAGIIGLSTAHFIRELDGDKSVGGRHVEVTVIAERFPPGVTSSVAAGLWEFYSVGSAGQLRTIKRWGVETFKHFLKLYFSPEAPKAGVSMVSGYDMTDLDEPGHPFVELYVNYRDMSQKELDMFSGSDKGVFFTTLLANPSRYLPWLAEKLKEQRVKLQQKKIEDLSLLADEFDVVVNCTGIGSVGFGDTRIKPKRGQVIKVDAPWIKQFIVRRIKDSLYYILPCPDFVVLGGTEQVGDWNMNVSEKDKMAIHEGCCEILPGLRDAKVIDHAVGLRPFRDNIRLEIEMVSTKRGSLPVVHNYGHGGAGVSLHWGCAKEAADLVKKCLHQKADNGQSKL